MSRYAKNILSLDMEIGSSCVSRWLWYGIVFLVGLICFVAGLLWWQWVVLILVAIGLGCSCHNPRLAVRQLSTKQIDGVWLLSVSPTKPPPSPNQQSKPLIHQAYLHKIRLVDLGITQVVVMQFYVIVPKKSQISVAIFADQINTEQFAKLAGLARLYPRT